MKNIFNRLIILLSLGLIFGTCFAREEAIPLATATNRNQPITLIEYYDDECPHCHRMGIIIRQLESNYSNLHVMYRATPILNENSWILASLVEAAGVKKTALHETLVSLPDIPTPQKALEVASRLGMNQQILLQGMRSSIIHQELINNIELSERATTSHAIALPLLVFSNHNKTYPDITLVGEQPYALLSAIVKQLE